MSKIVLEWKLKISKKKQQKIRDIINRGIKFFIDGNIPIEIFLDKLMDKIVNCLENNSERSLPQHRYYFAMCDWLSSNMPEMILRMLDVDYLTSEGIHQILKCKMKVDSTAFSSMEQDSFQEYFNGCKDWIATYLLKCKPDDIDEQIREQMDIRSKQ